MMDKVFKALLIAFPYFWHLLSKGSKWVFVAVCFLAITAYTLFVSWAAIRMEVISAYDERWYSLDNKVSQERLTEIKGIKSNIETISRDQGEMRTDIREIRNAILRPNNP